MRARPTYGRPSSPLAPTAGPRAIAPATSSSAWRRVRADRPRTELEGPAGGADVADDATLGFQREDHHGLLIAEGHDARASVDRKGDQAHARGRADVPHE